MEEVCGVVLGGEDMICGVLGRLVGGDVADGGAVEPLRPEVGVVEDIVRDG